MENAPINNGSNPTIQTASDMTSTAESKQKKGLKLIITVVVLIIVLVLLGFGYKAIANPFSGKSAGEISSTAMNNFFGTFLEGGLKVDHMAKIEMTEENGETTSVDVPSSITISKADSDGNNRNTHFTFGDVNLSPFLANAFGGSPSGQQADYLNFEIKTFEDALYTRINKLPALLGLFVPGYAVNVWIEAKPDTARESFAFTGVSGEELDLTEEEFEKLKDIFLEAMFADSDLESAKEVIGDMVRVSHKIDPIAMYEALIDRKAEIAKISQDVANSIKESDLEEIKKDTEDLELEIGFLIDKDFNIKESELEMNVESSDDTGFGLDLKSVVTTDDFTVDRPTSTSTFEELFQRWLLERSNSGTGLFPVAPGA